MRKITVLPHVHQLMLMHAYTTEHEEVCGLLIGNSNLSKNEQNATVLLALPQERIHKEKDRVEISPEQLSRAVDYCDEVSGLLDCKVNVIGWYHSHPHISKFPSSIDCDTQLNFQRMDPNFFGIILSVFITDNASFTQTISIIGFQSTSSTTFQEINVDVGIPPNIPNQFSLYKLALDNGFLISESLIKETKEQYAINPNSDNGTNLSMINRNILTLASKLQDIFDIVSQPFVESLMHMKDGLRILLSLFYVDQL